jgi:hypothetical protein
MGWFSKDDHLAARRALRNSIEQHGLDSRPKIASASIASEVTFFLRGHPPPPAQANYLPDVSDIILKLANGTATIAIAKPRPPSIRLPEKDKPPHTTQPTPKTPKRLAPLAMQMIAVSPRPTRTSTDARPYIAFRGPNSLIAFEWIPIRDLASLLISDGRSDAHIVDQNRRERGVIKLHSLVLAMASDDGASPVASLLLSRNLNVSEGHRHLPT